MDWVLRLLSSQGLGLTRHGERTQPRKRAYGTLTCMLNMCVYLPLLLHCLRSLPSYDAYDLQHQALLLLAQRYEDMAQRAGCLEHDLQQVHSAAAKVGIGGVALVGS